MSPVLEEGLEAVLAKRAEQKARKAEKKALRARQTAEAARVVAEAEVARTEELASLPSKEEAAEAVLDQLMWDFEFSQSCKGMALWASFQDLVNAVFYDGFSQAGGEVREPLSEGRVSLIRDAIGLLRRDHMEVVCQNPKASFGDRLWRVDLS